MGVVPGVGVSLGALKLGSWAVGWLLTLVLLGVRQVPAGGVSLRVRVAPGGR